MSMIRILITTSLVATVGVSDACGQADLPEWQQMSYRLTDGRTFAYVLIMEARSERTSVDVGGVILLHVKEAGSRETRVRVFDNLQFGNLKEFSAKLPRSSRLLPGWVDVNPFHGIRNRSTVDGELPYMMGPTFGWIFPRMPSGVGQRAAHEGYISRTRTVSYPSYFNWEGTAVREDGGLVRIEDERRFKSNDGHTYDVTGKGWFEFDKRDRLLSRRTYQGTHKIAGTTTSVNLYLERLSDKKLRALARNE